MYIQDIQNILNIRMTQKGTSTRFCCGPCIDSETHTDT